MESYHQIREKTPVDADYHDKVVQEVSLQFATDFYLHIVLTDLARDFDVPMCQTRPRASDFIEARFSAGHDQTA